MGRSYTQLTLKRLYASAGHYCPFPECAQLIVDLSTGSPITLGEIAHIVGLSADGPRADPSMSDKEKNDYDNLILLCPNHHSLIDSRPADFSVEDIRGWKVKAQQQVHQRLSFGATQVQFNELKLICNAYADGDVKGYSTPMIAVAPDRKMEHNGLTSVIDPLMNIGLSLEAQVADFIRKQAQLTSKFPDRLRTGFCAEYDRRKSTGELGDELFLGLVDFGLQSVCNPSTDDNQRLVFHAASVAVICHLFLICEVFERP